ncbi:cell wall hydrolase [Thalassospira sp.]|uniref:cell wall hydrolase n=1 Tax=Thalassospira sp. TaxID=1912094 RepID=UPI0027323449|nr:cell wall hydrolase [Thalassospira sp.]MDP2697573.1 cell wall hydrolase [Thalassospira sp.]
MVNKTRIVVADPLVDPAQLPVWDVLARTLYGEARGEDAPGIEAVAMVILNRVAYACKRGGYWWGNDVAAVCLKPSQFSCWNIGDPNRAKLLRLCDDDAAYRLCCHVARRALAGDLPDLVSGATHYHTRAVHPWWARGRVPVAAIGRHVFYDNIG